MIHRPIIRPFRIGNPIGFPIRMRLFSGFSGPASSLSRLSNLSDLRLRYASPGRRSKSRRSIWLALLAVPMRNRVPGVDQDGSNLEQSGELHLISARQVKHIIGAPCPSCRALRLP